jgi:hypothetical protein
MIVEEHFVLGLAMIDSKLTSSPTSPAIDRLNNRVLIPNVIQGCRKFAP